MLKDRLVFNSSVWAYALLHKDPEASREYLQHAPSIVARCQPLLHSALLEVEWEGQYEHLEYSPLVNERAHRKKHGGADIDNPQFKQQYQAFLEVLTFKPSLDSLDLLALTYYLVLQDRVDEVSLSTSHYTLHHNRYTTHTASTLQCFYYSNVHTTKHNTLPHTAHHCTLQYTTMFLLKQRIHCYTTTHTTLPNTTYTLPHYTQHYTTQYNVTHFRFSSRH